MTGKEKCEALREVRRKIAEQNGIDLPIEECTFQGDCLGTCPKCEEELRILEKAIEEKEKTGFATKLTNIATGLVDKCRSLAHKKNKSPQEDHGFPGEKTDPPEIHIMGLMKPLSREEDPYFDKFTENEDYTEMLRGDIISLRIPETAGVPADTPLPFDPLNYDDSLVRFKVLYRDSEDWKESFFYLSPDREVVIGRSPKCDVVIDYLYLARRQMLFRMVGDDLYIRDLGPTNPTYINGEALYGERKLTGTERLNVHNLELRIIRLASAFSPDDKEAVF